ncbi:hypothetical protein O629_02795 [Staphylococcus aureus M0598]|nr:hypothetical protein O629_02795 [Staphylococcus aureus M0598]
MMLKFKAWDKDKKVMSIIDEIDFNSGYILISTGYKSFNEVKLLNKQDLKMCTVWRFMKGILFKIVIREK